MLPLAFLKPFLILLTTEQFGSFTKDVFLVELIELFYEPLLFRFLVYHQLLRTFENLRHQVSHHAFRILHLSCVLGPLLS